MRFAHPFVYYAPEPELNKPRDIQKVRDVAAAAEVHASLSLLGYAYGEIILNHPGKPDAIRKIDRPKIGRNDLIVCVGRPPLNDAEEPDSRKVITRSYTDFEVELFQRLHELLAYCSRSRVALSPEVAKHLTNQGWKQYKSKKTISKTPPGFQHTRSHLANVLFQRHSGE